MVDGVHSRLRNTIIGNDKYIIKKIEFIYYYIVIFTENAKKVLGNLPLPYWWEPTTSNDRSSIIYVLMRRESMYNNSLYFTHNRA